MQDCVTPLPFDRYTSPAYALLYYRVLLSYVEWDVCAIVARFIAEIAHRPLNLLRSLALARTCRGTYIDGCAWLMNMSPVPSSARIHWAYAEDRNKFIASLCGATAVTKETERLLKREMVLHVWHRGVHFILERRPDHERNLRVPIRFPHLDSLTEEPGFIFSCSVHVLHSVRVDGDAGPYVREGHTRVIEVEY
jgi:hypothetical protein